ncbi:MAG TPA: STAS domain-containing protein [Actinomycetota bacterium]|jgi:anti-sigma B factor antagonist|nr:STAS domain-containing protein [Actinomycetota bacterium]
MAEGFRAEVRRAGDHAVIDMSGNVDRGAEPTLSETYARAAADGAPVLLNFADVDYINSTGIAVIVGLLAQARKEGRSLTACGLTEHYRQIFQITRLSDFMPIYDDEQAALGAQEATGS